MDKQKKYIPVDSKTEEPQNNQVIKEQKDKTYTREETSIRNPATKRKYSEQPPTKHNSKT